MDSYRLRGHGQATVHQIVYSLVVRALSDISVLSSSFCFIRAACRVWIEIYHSSGIMSSLILLDLECQCLLHSFTLEVQLDLHA